MNDMKDYEAFVKDIINSYKNNYFENPAKYTIPIIHNDERIGLLRPIPSRIEGDSMNDVALQTEWRNLHSDSFLVEPFVATDKRTLNWLRETYFFNPDRIIFMIEDINKFPIGHLAFENFIYDEQKCEYGRLMRGDVSPMERKKRVNLIELAQITFLNWGFNHLNLKLVYGTQFADNWTVNMLHAKCGFETIREYTHEKKSGVVKLADRVLRKEKFKLLTNRSDYSM
jgi:RimJ/RimL family protein N-acetyltransferase